MGLPDKWRRIGVSEDYVAETGVPAFVAVDAFGVVDTDLVERAIVLRARGWRAGGRWLGRHVELRLGWSLCWVVELDGGLIVGLCWSYCWGEVLDDLNCCKSRWAGKL